MTEEREKEGSDDRATVARKTPYELVFGPADFEATVFPRIQAEARQQGVDARDPDRFAFLSVVGDALRTVLPEDAPPDAMDQYRALLLHAYNFWCYGKRLFLVEPAVARFLVEAAPGTHGWEPNVPHPTIYLQLPPNLFWGSISPDSVPEPVDGFFVTCARARDALGVEFQRLEVLVVLGIRRDRAGFSVVPFTTAVGPGIPPVWEEEGREGGRDFESTLPGGEMAGLYSILTTTEALKLLMRALWFIDSNPACVNFDSPVRTEARSPGTPPTPEHSYFRVSLNPPAAERKETL
ncbi:hypothetical protein BH23GEM6_BH23GEM6_11420 [soil metagenome]